MEKPIKDNIGDDPNLDKWVEQGIEETEEYLAKWLAFLRLYPEDDLPSNR